tara:strand:- start:1688 stop:2236 length:549 start_codon:yes stop_codon:yes gene_type:complete
MSAWKTLSAIDVNKHTERKGNLTYLSWAWAWSTLMKHYPESSYTYSPPSFLENGTCEVSVSVTVEGMTHAMWLPVMDNRNNSIADPSSRDISDARMRCLVKAIAMHGLGAYIYAGEDLPAQELKYITADQKKVINTMLEKCGEGSLELFMNAKNIKDLDQIPASAFNSCRTQINKKLKLMSK